MLERGVPILDTLFFIGCVLSCCHVLCEHVTYEFLHWLHARVLFCTWLVICLLAMCLCFCFVCAMCSHVNCLDPTHLVTWLLVNLPHLSSLVILFICILYNLLVFAVPFQFVIVSPWMYPSLSCPVLSSLVLPSLCLVSVFPQGVVFVVVLVLCY